MASKAPSPKYRTLREFYPYYLSEHRDPVCRGLHFVGTGTALLLLVLFLFTARWQLLLAALLAGYGFAWVGHAFFERNRPATFTYPWMSLVSDFHLFFDILTRKQRIHPES
jgi:hypothetical protein